MFALVEVEITRIKHRAQHFVRNIISDAVAQQSTNNFPLCSRYIWFPSYACASLHNINCRYRVVDTEADLKLAMNSGNLGHSVKCVAQVYPEGFVTLKYF